MKLLYIANERIPSERANSIHIIKMCSEFAVQCVAVTLVLPQRAKTTDENIFGYYGVKNNFDIKFIKVPDLIKYGKYGFLLSQLIFTLKIFFNKTWSNKEYVVFTRDIYTSLFCHWRKYKVFHDLHGFPESSLWFWRFVLSRMDGIVCTNQWKIEQCKNKFGIAAHRLTLARNGFDPIFLTRKDKQEVRRQLDLPIDKKIVLYTGHLYDWKGVDVLAEAGKKLSDVLFVFVGGTADDLKSFIKKYGSIKNIIVVGYKPYMAIPDYIQAADVLVLPNSLRSTNPRLRIYSQFDTSPIKMFEYMASGRPIIAVDLPAIKEVLNDQNATLFNHDDHNDLAQKIIEVLKDYSLAEEKALVAQHQSVDFTWGKRVEKIINFINTK